MRVKADVAADEDDDEAERPRKTKKRKKQAGGIPLWGKAAIATIFAIVSIGGVLYWGGVFSSKGSQPRETQTAAVTAPNGPSVAATAPKSSTIAGGAQSNSPSTAGAESPKASTISPVPHPVRSASPASPQAANNPLALRPEASDEELFSPKDRGPAAIVKMLDGWAEALPPIVQDKEKMKLMRTAHIDQYRKSLVESFDRLYPKDSPGAAKAREGLLIKAEELALDSLSGFRIRETRSEVALDDAVAAGCTDPMVRYYQFKNKVEHRQLKPGEYLQNMRPIVLDIWKSGYADFRKMHAAHNLLVGLDHKDPYQREEIRTWEQRFWEAFERTCKDADDITQSEIASLAPIREDYQIRLGRTREQAHDEIAQHLEKAKATEYTRLAIQGEFLVQYAWDARGKGLANTVTETGARLMRERLQKAEIALSAAYKLDPNHHEAPTSMIAVCMGLGYDRDTMEEWFKRSMTANPFNSNACGRKLQYVNPKWYGSRDMSDWWGFVWQLVKTRNVDGRLPLVALHGYFVDAPLFVPMTQENFNKLNPWYGDPRSYHPLHAAITLQLRDRPDLKNYRGIHIRIACLTSAFGVAKAEMARLNGDFAGGGFKSQAEFDFYKEWIEKNRLPLLEVD